LPWFVLYVVMIATIYHKANLLALLLLGFGAVIRYQANCAVSSASTKCFGNGVG
jgi:hypothetical protein